MIIQHTNKAGKKLYRDTIVKVLKTFDSSDLGLPIRLRRTEAIVRPIITSKELNSVAFMGALFMTLEK